MKNKALFRWVIPIFLACGMVAAFMMIFYFYFKTQSCNKLRCFIMDGLGAFKTQEVYQHTDRVYQALLVRGQDLLRVEAQVNIKPSETNEFIKSQIIQMHTLYARSVAPYPGEITNAIVCPEEYQPIYTTKTGDGREAHYFTGYAGPRLTFGACARDLIAYRAIVAIVYCEELKQLYKLELFSPIGGSPALFEKNIQTIRTATCRTERRGLFKN